jgi:hypothetical protein
MYAAESVVADIVVLCQKVIGVDRDQVPTDVHRIVCYEVERVIVDGGLIYAAVDDNTGAGRVTATIAIAPAKSERCICSRREAVWGNGREAVFTDVARPQYAVYGNTIVAVCVPDCIIREEESGLLRDAYQV